MSRDTVPRLSKSKFMCGHQCHKRLWWEIHEPEAEELEIDPATQFIFDRGHEVGALARTYVPGGVLIDVPHLERERRLRETARRDLLKYCRLDTLALLKLHRRLEELAR